jgi:hypothetical protein
MSQYEEYSIGTITTVGYEPRNLLCMYDRRGLSLLESFSYIGVLIVILFEQFIII